MKEMMKTAVITEPGKVELWECPIPKIDNTEILVKMEACALCTWEQRVFAGRKKVQLPFIGGHEMAGKIVQLGSKVDKSRWKMEDKVIIGVLTACGECIFCKTGHEEACIHMNQSLQLEGLPTRGMGGMSEYLPVKPRNLFPYRNVTPQEAALVEPLSCVLQSMDTVSIDFADFVVVIGCGIMGMFHCMLALRRGAQVLAVDIDDGRLETAKEIGVQYTVNPSKENLHDRIMKLTDGIGARAVFDTLPFPETAQEILNDIGPRGEMVFYSSFQPDQPINLSPNWVHRKNVKISGAANSNSGNFIEASRLISERIIDVRRFISETYPFERAADAFASAAKADKYRVVVTF